MLVAEQLMEAKAESGPGGQPGSQDEGLIEPELPKDMAEPSELQETHLECEKPELK